MCRFFSLTSDGRGEIRYFNWAQRKRILDGELDYNPDSHTSINDFFGYKGELEDCRNKYEYNPITGVFTVDAIHGEDDSAEVERKVRALDFSQIVPQLVIKPIKNPLFVERKCPEPNAEEISVLKRWASVMASVGASVMASVWDSVWASVWAYISSFFALDEWQLHGKIVSENRFQPAIDLWEAGLVPSFDGKVWRLHAGKDAQIVYEMESM